MSKFILACYCELGYCPYCDDDEWTCDFCPYWVNADFEVEDDFAYEKDV